MEEPAPATVATVRQTSKRLAARPASVPEVTPGREHHRDPRCFARRDHLVVALRPAWLDDRLDTGLDRELGAVGEREERVRRQDRPVKRALGGARLVDREPNRIDPAHLTCTDPRCREVAAE